MVKKLLFAFVVYVFITSCGEDDTGVVQGGDEGDVAPPAVRVYSPTNDQVVQTPFGVIVYAQDDTALSEVEVGFEGGVQTKAYLTNMAVGEGKTDEVYYAVVSNAAPGENKLLAWAKDTSGNATTDDVSIIVDPQVIYVSESGNDANSGTKNSPFKTLSKAVQIASAYGDKTAVIKIAEGNYSESVVLVNGISVFGGYTSDFSSISGVSHIVGSGTGSVVLISNSESSVLSGVAVSGGERGIYVYKSPSVILSNITVSNCSGADYGGGILIYDSDNSRVLNSSVLNCSANYGGGIAVMGMSALFKTRGIIKNSAVLKNSAGYKGGGMYFEYASGSIEDSSISSNVSGNNGGGIFSKFSDVSLLNLTVKSNSAKSGGGFYLGEDSCLKVSSSWVLTNKASFYGGGIYFYKSSPELMNVVVAGNYAGINAGGIYSLSSSPKIINCTIWGNNKDAFRNFTDSHPYIINCIIGGTGDGHGIYEGTADPDKPSTPSVLSNNIFYACTNASYPNGDAYYYDMETSTTRTDANSINNMTNSSGGNITSDPLFLGDFHISFSSPAVDSGLDPSLWVSVSNDIDGESRPNSSYDIGADEVW